MSAHVELVFKTQKTHPTKLTVQPTHSSFHMYRLRLSHTNECPCGTGVQDPENTSYKTAQPTLHSKEHACGHLGAAFRDKLWGSKEELQATAQSIENIHLHISHDHTSIILNAEEGTVVRGNIGENS